MFKEATGMFLHAETSLHIGSGESIGAIDLSIQREKYTGFPMGQASGVKGAVREWFEKFEQHSNKTVTKEKINLVFGEDAKGGASEYAGAATFTDARILLFPVRSMKGIFAWITCPTVLERFKRDLAVADKSSSASWNVLQASNGHASGTESCVLKMADKKIVLEEYAFDYDSNSEVQKLSDWLKAYALPQTQEYSFWRDKLATNLLVLRDDDFTDFVKNSTEVVARVKLGDGKSSDRAKGGNLFYEENLPCDSLLYSLVLSHDVLGAPLNGFAKATDVLGFIELMNGKRLQIGGNETIGRGIVCVNFLKGGN